jgi:hypothetical protein
MAALPPLDPRGSPKNATPFTNTLKQKVRAVRSAFSISCLASGIPRVETNTHIPPPDSVLGAGNPVIPRAIAIGMSQSAVGSRIESAIAGLALPCFPEDSDSEKQRKCCYPS